MAPTLLVQCLRRVYAGGQWLEKESASRAMAKLVRNEDRQRKLSTMLTPREIEIVRLVAQGLTNAQIGAALFISAGTAKTHIANVQGKLGLHNRVGLAAWAWRAGLADPAA